MKQTKLFIMVLILFNLFGCSGISFYSWHLPYMMKVDQGNIITESQIKTIHIGMSKEQVQFNLGDSILSTGSESKLVYVNQIYNNDKKVKDETISFYFKNNNLIKIESKNI